MGTVIVSIPRVPLNQLKPVNLKRHSKQQAIHVLRKFAGRLFVHEIAQITGLLERRLRVYAHEIDISLRVIDNNAYSKDEDRFILDTVDSKTYEDIGRLIKRHASSVGQRARTIGEQRQQTRKVNQLSDMVPKDRPISEQVWSDESCFILACLHIDGYDLHHIALFVNRTYEATRYRHAHIKRLMRNDSYTKIMCDFLNYAKEYGLSFKQLETLFLRSQTALSKKHKRLNSN